MPKIKLLINGKEERASYTVTSLDGTILGGKILHLQLDKSISYIEFSSINLVEL